MARSVGSSAEGKKDINMLKAKMERVRKGGFLSLFSLKGAPKPEEGVSVA